MTKITNTWFQCALCPVEGDTYYLLTYNGKEIKVCKTCMENIEEEKNNEMHLSKMDRDNKAGTTDTREW